MAEPIVSMMEPEFTEDPIGAYARLRERAPLVRVGHANGPPAWLITRFEEVKAALSDPRFVVDYSNVPGHQGTSVVDMIAESLDLPDEFRDYISANMMFLDGERHARLRRLVVRAFTVRRMMALRPRVEEVSARLIRALERKGEGDLIQDYSFPLTGSLICELIGIDEADQPQVRKLMADYGSGVDRRACVLGMVEYTKEIIERRRREPADDMISTLVQANEEDGDRLSEAELVALVIVIVNNGHHSTSYFIPNAVLALFDNPDQLKLLRSEPEMLPHAIDELMRVANPVPTASPRYAAEDVKLGGVSVCKGDSLMSSLQAANYDPRVFADPERCDLRRVTERGRGHLSFGAGPHYCIGAALARLEGEIAIDHLLLKRDSLEITVGRDELRYVDEVSPGAARLLRALPVRL